MKSMRLPLVAIFFMTYFTGPWPPAPPGYATVLCALLFLISANVTLTLLYSLVYFMSLSRQWIAMMHNHATQTVISHLFNSHDAEVNKNKDKAKTGRLRRQQ